MATSWTFRLPQNTQSAEYLTHTATYDSNLTARRELQALIASCGDDAVSEALPLPGAVLGYRSTQEERGITTIEWRYAWDSRITLISAVFTGTIDEDAVTYLASITPPVA
jgi:hypothetical protein